MKAILEFTLPEDREEHECALKGGAYLATLQEYDNYLRGRLKHEDLSASVGQALQAARDILHEYAEGSDVSIW